MVTFTRSASATAEPRPQGCTNLKLRQLARRVTQHYDLELAKAVALADRVEVTMKTIVATIFVSATVRN